MSERDLKLPLGLLNGTLVAPDQVAPGFACNCTCPQCGRRLSAHKGPFLRWHFAHQADAECHGALETTIHLFAKQCVAHASTITIPALRAYLHGKPDREAEPEQLLALLNPRAELVIGPIRPDITADNLLIEIFVTHPVDDAKLAVIRQINLPAIEIDVELWRSRPFNAELLRNDVLYQADRKWLHHPRQAEVDAAALREYAAKRERLRAERLAEKAAMEAKQAEIAARSEEQRQHYEETQRIQRLHDQQRRADMHEQREQKIRAAAQASIEALGLGGLTIEEHSRKWRGELQPATHCEHCGQPGSLIPFGIGPWNWLHEACWEQKRTGFKDAG